MPKFYKIIIYTALNFFISYLTDFHWLTYLTAAYLIGLLTCEIQTLLSIIQTQNNLLEKKSNEKIKFSQVHKEALIESYNTDKLKK